MVLGLLWTNPLLRNKKQHMHAPTTQDKKLKKLKLIPCNDTEQAALTQWRYKYNIMHFHAISKILCHTITVTIKHFLDSIKFHEIEKN